MANFFDKVIRDFREASGGQHDEVIQALIAKKEEMGDDASEAEVLAAVKAVLLESLMSGLTDDDDGESITLSDDDREYMETATATVKTFLDENKWHYSQKSHRADLVTFELGFSIRGCNLRARIHVEARPKVCRIDAVLPYSAESTYEYPLCARIIQENYSKRFGTMKYDVRDGELLYCYSFLTNHGIFRDDLDILFHTIISSAVDCHEAIKKIAVGRFKKKESDEILKKIYDLVDDINGE